MDPDLRIWSSVDCLDTPHRSTDQKVGGSSPSERARLEAPAQTGRGLFRARELGDG